MIYGHHMKRAVLITTDLLRREMEFLNAINVYPVADGDTGTNLYHTLRGVADAVAPLESKSISLVSSVVAEAALESARGNSGVILSQFFWGFNKAVDGREYLDIPGFALALANGTKWAYNAVANPVEGTILTVMRGAAESARKVKRKKNVHEFLNHVLQGAIRALERTPELLRKLGKPKIIDSGGYGFVLFLEGFVRAFGLPVRSFRVRGQRVEREHVNGKLYCTNYLVSMDSSLIPKLRTQILRLGDSVVVVGGNGKVKVHIHTQDPTRVREIVERFGRVVDEHVDPIR